MRKSVYQRESVYGGVAKISRLLKMIGLFCKRALKKRQYSAKETYNFKEPTHCSHPISECNRESGSRKNVEIWDIES